MKIDIVQADDWEALYIDGESVYQGHSIQLATFVKALRERGLDLKVRFCSANNEELDEVSRSGYLPQDLKDLKIIS